MDTKDTSGPGNGPAQPLIQWRKVISLVGGQGVSLGGDYVLLIAMNWTAIQLGGARAVTVLMLASTIPRALTLIFGGAIADMLGPRFVLLRTTSVRIALLAVGTAVTLEVRWFWPLVAIALLDGVLLGLGSPSYGSLLPRFARDEHLSRANSLYSMVLRVSPIVGSPVGAWLIATGRLWPALLVASLTCSASLGCLLHVTAGLARPTPAPRDGESMLRRSLHGVGLLASHARLRWMFVASLCLDMAFGWPIDVALPLMIARHGWGVESVGTVIAAFSGGALLAAAVGAGLAHRIPDFVRLVVSGVGIAAGILTMALTPSPAALAAVACVVGVMSGFNGPAIVTVYQRSAPEAKMGAAMSMLSLASIGAGPVSIALFGSLSVALGLRATWMVCGVVALVAPLAAALALRHPARAAEPAEPAPADAATEARPEPQNPEPQNPEPQNSEPQNSEPQNSEPQNSEPQNSEPQNSEPVTVPEPGAAPELVAQHG
jgi:MFS transporter, DHA3 family, macrolide efflux protein